MDFRIDRSNFGLEQLALLTRDAIAGILGNVASSARNHWIKLAKDDNSHLKHDYMRSIQPVQAGENVWTVSLVGETAHLIEDGSPSVDMRDFLLGPNVPVAPLGEKGKHQNSKGGYYRAIPFRHTGPDSGAVIGQAMGSAYSKKLGVEAAYKLGKSIHAKAKQLKTTITQPGNKKTKWGGRLKAGYAPKLKAKHATDIYAGMIKSSKTYEKATQSSYSTFRTISTTSGKDKWIRKPIPARNYAEDVQKFMNRILPKAIDSYLRGVEGK